MIVRYALSRREILSSFWYSMKYSGTLRRRMFLASALPAGVSLMGAYLGRHEIGGKDLLVAAAWAAGAWLLMPTFLAVRAKTSERVRSVR